MDTQYTKAQARELFGADTDAELARKLGTSRQAINWYDDDKVLSEVFQWRIRALVGSLPGTTEREGKTA